MFSFNSKPLIIWGAGLLSLGFCKICDTLTVMLSEMVMFQFEQTNINVLIFTVLIGIVSPILSVIASLFLFRYLYSAATSQS